MPESASKLSRDQEQGEGKSVDIKDTIRDTPATTPESHESTPSAVDQVLPASTQKLLKEHFHARLEELPPPDTTTAGWITRNQKQS